MLTVSLMTTLLASPTAYRPNLHPCFHVARLARAHISNTRSHQHRFVRHQLPLRMLLGAEASASIMGIGAVGALRLLSTTIVPKRIRVMTDIDDTVKSSGNKRLLGIPLGGIDAQCQLVRLARRITLHSCGDCDKESPLSHFEAHNSSCTGVDCLYFCRDTPTAHPDS